MTTHGKGRPDQETDRRLGEAILYVASRMRATHAPYRGAVKLNKILWRADFEQFRKHGKPITGAEYQKLPMGPAPVRLVPVRADLEASGAIELARNAVSTGRPEEEVVPQREPDTSIFGAEELAAFDEAVAFFHASTGSQTGELSHELSAGWIGLEMNDVIPYETALIDPAPVVFPDGTGERVEQLIAAHSAVSQPQR